MKARRLADSFRYAIDGLIYSLRTQANMRIHLATGLLVLGLAIVLRVSRVEAAILCVTIGMVLFSEMLNTAIEAAVDLSTGSYHPLAKIAKNVAAGAVLVTAGAAVFVAFLIFEDKILSAIRIILSDTPMPALLTAPLSLGFTILVTIAMRAYTGHMAKDGGSRLIPSGFTAIAYCVALWICLRTKDSMSSIFALIGAGMVGYSRVDSRTKSLAEVSFGALIGVFGTLFFYFLSMR